MNIRFNSFIHKLIDIWYTNRGSRFTLLLKTYSLTWLILIEFGLHYKISQIEKSVVRVWWTICSELSTKYSSKMGANHLYTSDNVMLKSIMAVLKGARKWKKQEKNMNSKTEDKSRKCQRKYNPLCTIQSTILYIWHVSLFQMQMHIFTRHVTAVLNTIFLTAYSLIKFIFMKLWLYFFRCWIFLFLLLIFLTLVMTQGKR